MQNSKSGNCSRQKKRQKMPLLDYACSALLAEMPVDENSFRHIRGIADKMLQSKAAEVNGFMPLPGRCLVTNKCDEFIAARRVAGVGVGAVTLVLLTFISEVLLPVIRGALGAS